MAIDTGQGAAISISGITYNVASIAPGNKSRPSVDTTHLGTTGDRTKMAGDLDEWDAVTMTLQFDPTIAEVATSTAAIDSTITWPISDTTNTQAATLDGYALITVVGFPTLETNTLQTMDIQIEWVGTPATSVPTFTAET